jgi:hypothetical protein
VQRRHNCSPAASFTNCFMTLYLLKVHLQTFLSIPVTQKCQILICDTLVANERCVFAVLVGRFLTQIYCLIGVMILPTLFLSITNKTQRCIILFIIVKSLHVSSGLSARHQELKSVHTASGICQTCLLLPLAWIS